MTILNNKLNEIIKTGDEVVNYRLSLLNDFYVLKERAEGRKARVQLIGLSNQIPINEIRKNWLNNLSKKPFFIMVEGDYFPDLIEENGVYLVSRPFLDYLKHKITLGNIIYNMIGLVSKENRVEEYLLMIPEEVDCIKKNSVIYNMDGSLHYFEVDETKTGALQIFKITNFPHLVVTQKLNRIDYIGYECVSLENYCNYREERDRLYQERMSGKRLKDIQTEFEKQLNLVNREYKCIMQNLINRYELQQQLRRGFKDVIDSYSEIPFDEKEISDRFLLFFWSWDGLTIELAEEFWKYFKKKDFSLPALEKVKKFVSGLPKELEMAQRVIWETILDLGVKGITSINSYQKITQDQQFRWYLQDETFKYSLALIGDFKNPGQQKLESIQDLKRIDLSNQDLQEFKLNGKNLGSKKVENSNFCLVKFINSDLTNVQFINCDLTGVEFRDSKITAAKFCNCYLERTVFDTVKLEGAEFDGCYFCHTSFIESDLTDAKFKNQDLARLYFYKTKLVNATFEIPEYMVQNVFNLCNLENSCFISDTVQGEIIMNNCDFRNSDLIGCRFQVNIISNTNFVKAKLDSTDFTGCEQIIGCDLHWSSCFRMNLEGVTVEASDLSYMNLSMLKIKKNIRLLENNLSFTNLSGFDFSGKNLFSANNLIGTSLSNCNLENVDFCSCRIKKTEFQGAKLKQTQFLEEQLSVSELSSRQQGEVEIVKKTS